MSPDAAVALDADSAASAASPQLEPWVPLLAEVTPSLYRENPLRLLGLAAGASAREVARRFDELKLALDLGAAAFSWAFAPNPAPSADELRDAVQALKDGPRRVLYELFWFWPTAFPQGGSDPALAAWLTGDAVQAVELWEEAAGSGEVVAVHNLAVYHQLAAVEHEEADLANDSEGDGGWMQALAEWAQLQASDECWRRVTARIQRMEDARVPVEFAEWMRSALPDGLCGFHAALASRRAQRGQLSAAMRHVQFARRVPGIDQRAQPALERAVAQVVQGVDLRVRETTRRLAHDGSAGLALTADLLAEAADELEAVEAICGRDSEFFRAVCTRVVDAALEGIIAYQRRTLDSCGVLPWLTHLTTLPASPEVRRRLEETADVLHANAIAEKLAPDGGAAAPDSAAEFAAAYRLLVEEFIPGAGLLDFGAHAHADYLANVRRALRELAHAVCHQLDDLELAARALEAAEGISEGGERAALADERADMWARLARRQAAEALLAEAGVAPAATLAETAVPAAAETAAFRLEGPGGSLEISAEGIAFEQIGLRSAELTGLRYGVREAAGGPEGERVFSIAWCTAETVVELDAANLLGPGPKAEQRYHLVLEALYRHVVPGLIARLAEWIRTGQQVPLGGAMLREDGYVFSGRDFPWPGGVAVPYSQIAHAFDDGQLLVARAAAPTEVEHHLLVEVWNAAVVGHLIDVLAAAETPGDPSL